MANVVYRKNLTQAEAEQMAFELKVEGRFEFEVKEEGGAWSVHYWSKDERPAATTSSETAGPAAPTGGLSAPAAPVSLETAPPNITVEPAPTAPTCPSPPAGWVLGTLSRQYEVGDRGPGTVSTGRGDPGGVS